MKKYLFLILLVILSLVCASGLPAQIAEQTEHPSIEQLQQEIQIQRRQIREAAKSFLVDELPIVLDLDPQRATQELQNFSSTLSSLGDEEISLLLGHMYARIGEDDKAITIFDSLLRTELNTDARKMLNIVLYRKLAKLLESGQRDAASQYLQHIIFNYYNTGEYFPAYLYLYADISADDRDFEPVLELIHAYNLNRDLVLGSLLPTKQRVLDRLNQLDLEGFYADSSTQRYREIASAIDQIKLDLSFIHSEMLGMQGMLFIDQVVEAHALEIDMLDQIKHDLSVYANAETLISQEMAPALDYIEAIKANLAFYDRVLILFDNHLQQNFLKLSSQIEADQDVYAADLYLDRIYQIDRTISIYDEQLEIIDELLASGDFPQDQDRLLQERAMVNSDKLEAEELRRGYVADLEHTDLEDRSALLEILDEYNALVQDRKLLLQTTLDLEEYIKEDAQRIISRQKRGDTRENIAKNVAELRHTDSRHQDIVSGYDQYYGQIEFLSIHLSYRDLMADYHDFLYSRDQISEDEWYQQRDHYRDKQLELISDIEGFLAENPNFSSFMQPDGQDLVGTADLYYKLGELQYYAHPADPVPALQSFSQAADLDAELPQRDLALYNVAVISSEIKRAEIDQNKIDFRARARVNEIPPANSLYSEANFAETLLALEDIVQNYHESEVYEKSVYRLGLLYFRFADDSPDPDYYHNLAINQFDQILTDESSPLYHEALYQRGWVRLNSFADEDLRQAMDDFITILRDSEDGKIADPQLAADYRADAIDNIAYCLIALDGTDFYSLSRGVNEVITVFVDYDNDAVIQEVIDKAVENKLNMGVSVQAIDFLKLRLEHNPLALENPILLDSMLVLYHNSSQRLRPGEDLDQITQDIYQQLIDDYNPDSAWYQANAGQDIARQLQIVDNAFEQRRIRLFNLYAEDLSRNRLQTYEELVQRYDAFASIYAEDFYAYKAESDSIMVNVYAVLADETQDVEDYLSAIDILYTYNEEHPNNSQFYENEELAMNYSRNVYAQVAESLAELDQESTRVDEAFDFLRNSADRFILVSTNELHSNPERRGKALDIMLLMGDIQFGREHYPDAIQFYTQALEQEELLSNADKRDTYLKLAEISMREQRHAEAEEWLKMALPLAGSAQEAANINQDILVQIQSSFEDASASGDYLTEATERLRLADSLDPSRTADILGHRVAAVQAFINAREYERAIELLMVMAEADTNLDAIYARYDKAYEIASSADMMNNPTLARNIEQEFIDQYPASNYSFRLRLANINDMSDDNPAQAAELYLALFEEVRSGDIDPGDVAAHDLLADSILMYARSGDISTEYALRHRFIELYPDHSNVIPYMEYMAKGHLDRDEMDEYTALAREILNRSPDKSTYYQFVADTQLQRIAGRFDTAYMNQEYEEALAIRDEYLADEAGFIAEGLSFANSGVHEVFAAVQAEYDGIQERNAFLQRYDDRLTALENSSIFTSTPAQQIRVVAITTWDRNLNGGDQRIPRYRETIAAEVAKVTALIREANETGYFIDNHRRLRAMDLISRLYERGAEVVSTQLEQYFRITNEAAYYRDQYPGDALDNVIAQFNFQQTQEYLNNAVSWQYEIFRQYHLAGFENEYTISAHDALEQRGLLNEYRIQALALDSSWQQELNPSSNRLDISAISSPKGKSLGSTMIPAGNTLKLSKNLDLSLEPDFAYLQIVFPMDISVMINGNPINSSWVPIDSLEAGKAVSTVYSFLIPGEFFNPGENAIQVELQNSSSDRLKLALGMQLCTSSQRILANIPPETRSLHSGTDWKIIITDPETDEEQSQPASEAAEWNITWDNVVNMEPTSAIPIWISELEAPVDNIVFETELVVQSDFIEGMIDLVAPESVDVYLNGSLIGSSIFDYDPDPLEIYKGQVLIPAQNVVVGKNILRFEVSNASSYRGFLASVTYSQTGKEETR